MLYLGVFTIISLVWVIVSKLIWNRHIALIEIAIQLLASVILTVIVFGTSYYANTNDYQTLNGEVKEKIRDNDSHEESYSCNCRTVSSGSGKNSTTYTQCDTCWRTVYTVDWYLKTTIGDIGLDHESSYSMSVWNSPDPQSYIKAYIGEPCAKKSSFVNYVQAASKSLFNTGNYSVSAQLPVPDYPELTYDYHINSVFNVGTKVDVAQWNNKLRDKLKTLSAKKQVNIIVLFVNTLDKSYRYKVEKEWKGGKKNDYVIIVGTTDNNTAQWVDGFTFGLSQGNFLLISEVSDELRGKTLDQDLFIKTITDKVNEKFVRKSMKDFEYLAKEIRPSDLAMGILIVLQLVLNIGFTIFNIKNEV